MHGHGWMTDQRFADLFAIAQAAPGPNIIRVTDRSGDCRNCRGARDHVRDVRSNQRGRHIVGHFWHRFRQARWRIVIQAGVTPITVGLVAATAYLLGRAVDTGVVAVLITIASATVLTLTRVHPLVFLAIGAAVAPPGSSDDEPFVEFFVAVSQHLHLLQRDEAATHHLGKGGRKASIFAGASTISITRGDPERRRIFAV